MLSLPCFWLSTWHDRRRWRAVVAASIFWLSTRYGRSLRRTAGAVWPFRVEANSFHLELRHREWTFQLPPSVPGEMSGLELSILVLLVFPLGTVVAVGGLPVRLLSSGFPPGTVLAAGGLPVPFGRSRWKHFAPTWNSDRRNGGFCCRPPFQVKGRGQSRLIIAFPAFHRARSPPLGDRRCRLAVPGGSKMPPPGTPTSGMDVSVATLRSK